MSRLQSLETRVTRLEQSPLVDALQPFPNAEFLYALPLETDRELIQAYLAGDTLSEPCGIFVVIRREGSGFIAYAYMQDGTPYIAPPIKKYHMNEMDYYILNLVEEESMRKREILIE